MHLCYLQAFNHRQLSNLAKNDLQKGVSKTFIYLCLSVISCHCDLAIIIIQTSVMLSPVYCYILFKCITLKLEESDKLYFIQVYQAQMS